MCATGAQVLGKSWNHNKSESQVLHKYDVLSVYYVLKPQRHCGKTFYTTKS